jgi:hypothetical protein
VLFFKRRIMKNAWLINLCNWMVVNKGATNSYGHTYKEDGATWIASQIKVWYENQNLFDDSDVPENLMEEMEMYINDTEESTIPITLGHIKATCGWTDYCNVTGSNHYMLKEWDVEDREIFDVKESHAKELGLIN